MIAERWLPVPGWEGFYEVSDFGRVRSLTRMVPSRWGTPRLNRGRMMTLTRVSSGHLAITLSGARRWRTYVHQVVLLAFVGPMPAGMVTRHLNGIPDDNRLANIVYGTPAQNTADRARLGEEAQGERHWKARLTETEVRAIRRQTADADFGTLRELAERFGVDSCTVLDIAMGRRWKHLPWLPGEAPYVPLRRRAA